MQKIGNSDYSSLDKIEVTTISSTEIVDFGYRMGTVVVNLVIAKRIDY